MSHSEPVSTSCLTVGALGYHIWLQRGSWDLNSGPQAWTIRIDSLTVSAAPTVFPLTQVHCSCALRPGGKGLTRSLEQLLSRLSAVLPQARSTLWLLLKLIALTALRRGCTLLVVFRKLILCHAFAVYLKISSHAGCTHNVFCLLLGAAKSSPASKPGSTPSRPSSAKRASSSGSASRSDKDLETQVIQLNEQVIHRLHPCLWKQCCV